MKAVIQLRGEVNQSQAVRDTLAMLNLHRVNHATLIPEKDTYTGMITKVHDWVAYGEPSESVVATILSRRGEPAEGSASIDDAWVSENTQYDSIGALASALCNDETTLQEVGLAPTIRLHPPRGGHAGIKHPTLEAGQIGKHSTEEIDSLLTKMR